MKKFTFIIILFVSNLLFSKIILANELSAFDIKDDEFFIGDKNAPVTIIEYASMSCSHCATFHTNTLPKDINGTISFLMPSMSPELASKYIIS